MKRLLKFLASATLTILAVLSLLAGMARAEALGQAHPSEAGPALFASHYRVHLAPSEGPVGWSSPQAFGSRVAIVFHAYRDGHEIASYAASQCRGVIRGRGVLAEVRVCGGNDAAPVRLTYSARHPFTLVYWSADL